MDALVLSLALWLGAPVDRDWFERMLLEEVTHRRAAASTPSGFFRPNLDRRWQPLEQQSATLVSQSRLIYVMATGWEATHRDEFRRAAGKGAEFLIEHFRDARYGGWLYRVSPDGRPLEDVKDSYGYAFVIFGLSHAYEATGEERFRQAALETWRDMKAQLRDGEGFFRPRASRDFVRTIGPNSQNPLMHLFEALLALHDVTESSEVFEDALGLAEAVTARLVRNGYLPELFDAAWAPLAPRQGGRIEIGHQFEWAFLLSRAVAKGFPRRYLEDGERLLEYGMRTGYDARSGGIFSVCDYEGRIAPGAKGWWQQAELLRALLHYAAFRDRTDLWTPFRQSLQFVRESFIDPEYGGWYDSYEPDHARDASQTNKGSLRMVGYHVVAMYAEALAATRPPACAHPACAHAR